MRSFDDLFASTRSLSKSLSAFIRQYGIAKGIALGAATPEVAIDDFYYYCIAKSSKHLRAALVLVGNELPEDAMVVGRAAYECYVNAAYAKKNGVLAIDDLVYNPVGFEAGTVEFKKHEKSGKPNFRRLVDKRTEEEFVSPPSIEKMILNSGYADDAVIHRYLYGFTSEHAHVNMAGSGNYRDGTSYTDLGDGQRPNAVLLAAYITALIVGLAVKNTELDNRERMRIDKELRLVVGQINAALDNDFKDLPEFANAARSRLIQCI